jgi:signal transduction histidine kinase
MTEPLDGQAGAGPGALASKGDLAGPEDLAAANARLAALVSQHSRFTSDVCHELRTPLTNMRLYIDLLAHGRPDRRGQYLAVLSRETERLRALIDDLSTLSQLENIRARGVFSPADMDLGAVVAAELPNLAARAEAAGLRLSPALPDRAVTVLGDVGDLARVVTELVGNGIAYTPRGGEVTIEVRSDGGTACLAVGDTGLGVPAVDQPHVFECFYRGENARASGAAGTGLGLAIVRAIVELHGGTVTIDPARRVGTRIEVRLPERET